MRILLSLILILALAFLGHRWPSQLGEGPHKRIARFFGQGVGLIAIGIALGPLGLNLIDQEILSVLTPLKVLTLAWVGLLFGLQFDRAVMGPGPPKRLIGLFLLEGLGSGWVTALFCLPWIMGVIGGGDGIRENGSVGWLPVIGGLYFTISALAGCSSYYESSDAEIRRATRKWPLRPFFHYAAAGDQLVALLLLWAVAAFGTPTGGAGGGWVWISLPLFLGVAAGFLIALLSSRRVGRQDRLTIAMGGVLLVSGVAMNMNLPVLLVSTIAGIVIANASPGSSKLSEELLPAERPLFLVMLLLIGTSWRPGQWGIALGLALTYTVGRVLAKFGFAWITGRRIGHRPSELGMGLLFQGAFALAVLIDSSWFLHPEWADTVSTALLLGILMSDALGAASFTRLSGQWLASEGMMPPDENATSIQEEAAL